MPRKFTSRKKTTDEVVEGEETAPQEKEAAVQRDEEAKKEEPDDLPAGRQELAAPEKPEEIEEKEEDGIPAAQDATLAEAIEKDQKGDEGKMDDVVENETAVAGETAAPVMDAPNDPPGRPFENLQMDSPSSDGGKKWVVLLLILLVVAGGLFFAYKKGLIFKRSSAEDITPSSVSGVPSSYSTPTPAPAASPSAKAEDLTFSVLNGTKVAGEASALKTILSDAGFKNITTDNATGDYTTTEVTYPDNLSSAIQTKISNILESRYEKVTVKKSSASTTAVTIIVGTKKS